MMKTRNIFKQLVLPIILFSSLLSVLVTIAELYYDYDEQVTKLNTQINEIKFAYLEPISESLWTLDQKQLNAITHGIMSISIINYVAIKDNSSIAVSHGTEITNDKYIKNITIPIIQNKIQIGEWKFQANKKIIIDNITTKLLIVLFANFIKTIIVSFFIFFLLQKKFFSHISFDKQLRLTERIKVGVTLMHEFSQPLFAMKNYANTTLNMLKNIKGTEDSIINIKKINEQIQFLTYLMKRTRSIDPSSELKIKTVNLKYITEQSFENVRRTFNISSQLSLTIDKKIPILYSDIFLLKLILVNLFKNSFEAIQDAGTNKVKLKIDIEESNDGVNINVSDNGPGMTKKEFKMCMIPFYTSKANGTGVGFSLIVDALEDIESTIKHDPSFQNGCKLTIYIKNLQKA